MIPQTPDNEIPARLAAELAGITYRQLDYWARRGWVRPSVEAGLGRAGRRLYGKADVIRLAALGSFGRAGLDVGRLGPPLAQLELPLGDDFLVTASLDGNVEVVDASDLRSVVCQPVPKVTFDPVSTAEALGIGPIPPAPAGVHRLEVSA